MPKGRHRHDGRLAEAEAEQLSAMIREHGYEPTARRLGVGVTVIDKILHGGTATAATMGRVRDRLTELRVVAA